MKNTLNDDKIKDKFTEEDKKVINETCDEGLKWIEANQASEASEFEAK